MSSRPERSRESAIAALAETPELHPGPDYFAKGLRRRGALRARIVIADLGLTLEGLSVTDRDLIRDRYGIFVREGEERAGEARIEVVDAEVPSFLRPLEWRGGAPELYRLEQFWLGSRLFVYSYEFAGWHDRDSGEGQLALASCGPEALHRAVENYLRSVFAHRFLERGAFLLHGSGVVRGGRAHVFFGPSGSGKTTVTLLSGGDLILGDDLVLIREGTGGPEACSVPFRGVFREPPATDRAFPLAGFYRLVQHSGDSLEVLSAARGAAELLGSLPFVMEGGGGGRALEAVSRIVSRVPVRRLRFRKSPEFWKLLSEP